MFASKLYADILQEVSLARKALKMDLTSKSSTSVRMYYTGASSNAYKGGSIQIIENLIKINLTNTYSKTEPILLYKTDELCYIKLNLSTYKIMFLMNWFFG